MRLFTIPAFVVVVCSAGCRQTPASAPAVTGQSVVPSTPAAPAGGPSVTTATGTVAETMNAGGYTYVRLQTDKGDIWIAATVFPVKVGERLTAQLEMPMPNFHSNSLNRDFPMIYFVPQVAREGQALLPVSDAAAPEQAGGAELMGSHPKVGSTAASTERIAPPTGGLSIADVLAKRKSLAGKPVVVRGKVVKVNNNILDRNWIHLQDGSGSADKGTNDLTVTTPATAAAVAVGDIVTVSGVLGIDKDLGAGYAYDAILEQGVIKR